MERGMALFWVGTFRNLRIKFLGKEKHLFQLPLLIKDMKIFKNNNNNGLLGSAGTCQVYTKIKS
jgi:hypothetical protein